MKNTIKYIIFLAVSISILSGCSNKKIIETETNISSNYTKEPDQIVEPKEKIIDQSNNQISEEIDKKIDEAPTILLSDNIEPTKTPTSSEDYAIIIKQVDKTETDTSKITEIASASPTINIEATEKEIEVIKETEEKINDKTITLQVLGLDETILAKTTILIQEGDTVFSVTERTLKEKNIPFSARGSSKNKYVEGINNIYEFEYGPKSGFTYSVNDIYPTISSSQYELIDGDIVVWRYNK